MSRDGFSSGVSQTLSFIDTVSGTLLFNTAIESFTAKLDSTIDKFVQTNGVTSHPQFYMGGSGSFVVGRDSNYIDNYFISQQDNYLKGNNQVDVTITETIIETSGAISQYQYLNCVLNLDDSGTWSGTEIVKQHISFAFSLKKPLS